VELAVPSDGVSDGDLGHGRRRAAVEAALLAQRGQLLSWAPVALGTGIAIYFALPAEPGLVAWSLLGIAVPLVLLAGRLVATAYAPLLIGLALIGVGMGLSGFRTWIVTAPVLEFRYYGAIEGRIVGIDRSASDALRLTLDYVVLDDMPPDRTPASIRVSLRGDQRWLVAEPGRVVLLTGHLSPPSGPSEPGDFDFRRTAWFEKLGAVGWTETPVLTKAAPEGRLWLHRLRTRLSEAVRARIAGDAGGLAAAVMTGDRSGLSMAANQAMRDSGLYHLVSISGTHMGLLVGFVFALVRTGIALVPPLALRVNGKKVAAWVALPAAAFYLALAGRDVATERSFIMVAVMLGAVLLDRQAVTLRSVAIAALIVLLLRPEGLVNPGFQMSFAAVVALSFVYRVPWLQRVGGRWRWVAPVAVMLLSSLVAGFATAPYAGAHFNRFTAYGLLANTLAVPAMGVLVMPGAVILAIGALVGLTQPALFFVELGCRWILLVSEVVAGLKGATTGVVTPPASVLPLLTFGAFAIILWNGRLRWAGLPLILLGLGFWATADRPALLIAQSGGVMGLMTQDGRAISRPTGDSFVVDAWLENDGDVATQEEAANRAGLAREEREARAEVGGTSILLLRGKQALAAVDGCGGAQVLVTDQDDAGTRPCVVLDALTLRRAGAVAAWPSAEGLELVGT
jgi:competence protein ComEC